MPNELDQLDQLDPEPTEAVVAQRGGGRTSFYQAVNSGLWTPPVPRGGRRRFWPKYETRLQLQAVVAGASEPERRALVQKLMERRRRLMPQLEELPPVQGKLDLRQPTDP